MFRGSRGISDCCALYYLLRNIRSHRLEMFCKKDVLKILQKFTGKCRSLFFNKVADLRPKNVIKKETLTLPQQFQLMNVVYFILVLVIILLH